MKVAPPGATTSGLMRWSQVGPAELYDAILSCLVVAPTAMTFSALAGEAIRNAPPEFPAEAITTTPASTAALAVMASGSVPSGGHITSPKLMEMISAPLSTAYSIPDMIDEALPQPWLSSTLMFIIEACGATPIYSPPDDAPLPAMIPATCVPCPNPSFGDSPDMNET